MAPRFILTLQENANERRILSTDTPTNVAILMQAASPSAVAYTPPLYYRGHH